MTISLFTPDLFCTVEPTDHQPSSQNEAAARGAAQSYAAIMGAVRGVNLIGARDFDQTSGDANGVNFRLDAANGTFFLKRVLNVDTLEAIDVQLEIIANLAALGLPVAAALPTERGELVLERPDGHWYATPYVSGRYFSGQASEIKNTGRALGDVLGSLAGLASGEALARTRPSYFSDAEVELMSEISAARSRWVTLFGAANAAVMADGWHIAEREFPALRKVSPDLNSRAKRLTHFDLHPHNILLRDDELVAVLDFDACHQMPVELAIAFATLKLMKRVEVERLESSRAGTLTEDVNVFLAAVAETLPKQTADRALLCNFAKAEAMRRLLSVCRRHMAGRTFLWNDIPVHLAALAEADVIF